MGIKRNYKKNIIRLFLFIFAMLIYSLSAVMGKLAAVYPFFSLCWICWYIVSVFMMFVYAVFWQQILKYMELGRAYAGRSVVTVVRIFWGWALFHEKITAKMIVGSVIVVMGVIIIALDQKGIYDS